MVACTKSDDRLLARYTYDALKRRVSRTVWSADSASSATVLYVWDDDHVVEERLADGANSGLGTLVAEYVWGAPAPNGLLAQRRTASHPDYSTTLGVGTGAPGGISGEPAAGALAAPAAVVNGEWTLPVVDHLGHLRVVMAGAVPSAGEGGGSGSGGAPPAPAYVLERRGLSAFGLPRAVSSATGLPLVDGAYVASGSEATALFDIAVPSAYGPYLLTGHAWDPAAAQHYAWHRWVSPRLGRFTSPSPLTYPIAELNYEWVGNSPYDIVDEEGLRSTGSSAAVAPVTAPVGASVTYVYRGQLPVPVNSNISGALLVRENDWQSFVRANDAIQQERTRQSYAVAYRNITGKEIVPEIGLPGAKPSYATLVDNYRNRSVDEIVDDLEQSGDILFGQRRFGPSFSDKKGVPDYLAGKRVRDIVEKLKSGELNACQITIHYFVNDDGRKVADNTRGLATLSMAGLKPVTTVRIPISDKHRARLGEDPVPGYPRLPARRIPMTPRQEDDTIIGEAVLP